MMPPDAKNILPESAEEELRCKSRRQMTRWGDEKPTILKKAIDD
jgi:hypothetical protein